MKEMAYSCIKESMACSKIPNEVSYCLARLGKLYYDYLLRKWIFTSKKCSLKVS